MQAQYEVKVQVIRAKKQAARFYVNIPLPLAAALDLARLYDLFERCPEVPTGQRDA